MPLERSGATSFELKGDIRSRLLGHLANAPMTTTELATMESKHLSHVSRALSELCAQGLVERMSHETREHKYRVTDEGLALYASSVKNPR